MARLQQDDYTYLNEREIAGSGLASSPTGIAWINDIQRAVLLDQPADTAAAQEAAEAANATAVGAQATADAAQASANAGLKKNQNLADLANALDARTNLGVRIGIDVQAYDDTLADLASRNIGAASPTDILDRQAGDARYTVAGGSSVTSFNTRTGAVTLTAADVTSVGGLIVTGLNASPYTVSSFKLALALVKADVGLGNVDNTADAVKVVASAAKLTTARNINGVAFDGTAAITISAVDTTTPRVPATRLISTTAPITGGGDLSADRTLAISPATTTAPGSLSAADKVKLDATSGTNTGDQTTITGNAGTATKLATPRTITASGDITWSVSFDGSANVTAAATLPNVNGNVGTVGAAFTTPVVQFDAKGRALSATSVPTLDYLANTFTPTLLIGGSATGITYTTQMGRITRVGRVITAQINIVLSSKGTGTGNVTVGGLTIANATGVFAAGTLIVQSVTSFASPSVSIPGGSSTINVLTFNGSTLALATAANLTNTSELYITITYTV